jgi:hypothetical protein
LPIELLCRFECSRCDLNQVVGGLRKKAIETALFPSSPRSIEGCEVVASFDGGVIASDAGALLLVRRIGRSG